MDPQNRLSSSSSSQNDNTTQNGGTGDTTDALNKRIRLAKAQAEIDRILNNPCDPPFDFEKEMKKVVSISPPLIPEGSTEFELEEQVSQMEEDLYSAVKAQDFTTAAQRQGEISQLHVDDCGLVLQVNSAFYKAFSNKDIQEMERIWLKDRSCICIHPSFKPLSGVRDIMHTWKRMFESSVGSFQRTWIDPCDIQITVKATTAVVTCEEHVYARRFVRGKKRESELVNKLMATNIFRKVGGKWYMTYHHSSWHADSEAAKLALQRGNNNNNNGFVVGSSSSVKTTMVGPPGSTTSRRRRPEEEDENAPTGLESIMGLNNVGPLLGNDPPGREGGRQQPSSLQPLKDYIFGLNNMLGRDKGDDNDLGNSGAIIHFSRIESDNDDDDDDDDGEDDNGESYEIYDEEDNDGDDESFSSLQSWVKRTRAQRRNRMSRRQQQQQQQQQQSRSEKPLRQECIDSLRKLANEGRISPKQKRVLLTDIISCSSKGESSMVEVAYDLLCGEGKDPEEAEEEFVDQCRVLAQSFSEPRYQ